MLNENERKGKADQVKGQKGHVKQAFGPLTGGENVKAKKTVEEIIGKAEEAARRASRNTGNASWRP